ncbi:MAG: hypothetical protein Q9212_006356 [Teloschistes hypoglaucus]
MAQAPSKNPLEDKNLFTTQIYAQSLLDFHARPGSATGAYIVQQDTAINKHLNLLNGLALLLTKKQGDVVATWIRTLNSSIIFYWAKLNNEKLPTESEYISGLINQIRKDKKSSEILTTVINFTYGKIIHRCRKLGKQYGLRLGQLRYTDSNLLQVDISHPKYVELQKFLSESDLLYHKGSLVNHLDQLIRMIADIKSTAKTDKVAKLLNHVWVLFSQEARLSDFIDSKDCNRWRKLADFLRTVLDLKHNIKMLERNGIANFEFEQILATVKPQSREHAGLLVDAMNAWHPYSRSKNQIQDYQQIKEQFEDASPGKGGIQLTTFVQHCELTVAVYFLRQNWIIHQGKIEIGVSKSSCFGCHKWIESYGSVKTQNHTPQIIVRSSHGKKTNGWALPDYDLFKPMFLDALVQEIQRGYETCTSGRRKSDSAPLSDQEFDRSSLKDLELKRLDSDE